MPGRETDYNLREVTRALGRQNPEWDVRETIQPTLDVGSLAGLTPVHAPPTGTFRSRLAGVAGSLGGIIVQAHGAGGTLIARARYFSSTANSLAQWGLVGAIPGGYGTAFGPFGPFSNVAITTEAFDGVVLSAAALFPPNTAPLVTSGGDQIPDGLWIPPGGLFACEHQTTNASFNFVITVVDVPVGEGGR